MKEKKSFLTAILILICFLTSCSNNTLEPKVEQQTEIASKQPTVTTETVEKQGLDLFIGEWVCEAYKTKQFEADMTLNIFNDDGTPRVLLSTDAFGFYFAPVADSVYADGKLIILLNSEEYRATITLSYTDKSNLNGTYNQYSETTDIQFSQVSQTPTDGEFYQITAELTFAERLQQLSDYELYQDDGEVIPFTYKLNEREPWLDIIEEYDLDALTKDKTDVEIMKELLFWVSNNFKHGNPKEAPSDKREAVAIIEACRATGGYTNCRGLSLILADLCRAYGIPAKHITCLPKETKFSDCHVVVIAYSNNLNQWIMLDPTYKLILQDENGAYIDLQKLRDYLIHDKTIVPNEEFSYNGSAQSIKTYKEYMTKNTFRFTSATDFYYGAEESYNGNTQNMLIPFNYTEDFAKTTTTSDEEFWKSP